MAPLVNAQSPMAVTPSTPAPQVSAEILAAIQASVAEQLGNANAAAKKQSDEREVVWNNFLKEKDATLDVIRRRPYRLMGLTALVCVAAFIVPIALYLSTDKWAYLFEKGWPRVVAACVPQVIVGLVCIVAIIAHARDDFR